MGKTRIRIITGVYHHLDVRIPWKAQGWKSYHTVPASGSSQSTGGGRYRNTKGGYKSTSYKATLRGAVDGQGGGEAGHELDMLMARKHEPRLLHSTAWSCSVAQHWQPEDL
jgi:hypothetical protein